MAKVRKTLSIKRLNESAVKSTMKTMSIEGRLPLHAPKQNTTSTASVVANFKSSSRNLIG